MLQLTYPGIYTKEEPSGVRSVAGAPTSVALFVGPTRTGIDLRRTRILNFGDFERNFGTLSQTSSLSYSVLHFFANGGGEAYVMRVPGKNAVPASMQLKRAGGSNPSLSVKALSSGAASGQLFIEIDPFGIGADPFGASPDQKKFSLTIIDPVTGRVEKFRNLTTSSSGGRFAPKVVNDAATGSKLVEVTVDGINSNAPQPTGTIYRLKALPSAAAFSSDVLVNLEVAVRNAAGADDPGSKVTLTKLVVFRKDDPTPGTVLELATKLQSVLNAAIQADDGARASMEGVGIIVEPFEGGKLLRLTATPPAGTLPTKRLNEAVVTIDDPATGTGFPATFINSTAPKPPANPSRYRLGSAFASGTQVLAYKAGADGDPNGQPDDNEFLDAISSLEQPDPFFNILCLPDVVRPTPDDPMALQHSNAGAIYAEAARICAEKHAFLLIDPPPNVTDVLSAEAWKSLKIPFSSTHSAAYFPNVLVDDPLEPGSIRSHPPSGAMAGVIARTDAQYGVWQAPAGTEAVLASVYGPEVELSYEEQGILNPIALNVIRRFPIFGTVSFGSRTVDGANAIASDWKYIPVRRTASYILRSLSEGLRWAVHKPNGESLWAQLRLAATSFMHGMFRQGAFKGVSARQAYFVMCDASTTTQDDIDQGVVNIVIGFAPLKPAEFVVITLRQIVQPAL